MLEILYCASSDIDADLLASYRDLLDADECERLAAFRRETAAQTYLVSRALLRTVLANKLNCAPQALRFIRDANDKPQLDPAIHAGSPALHFNLSHSEDCIALALSDAPVGIDVESSDRRNNLLGIAKRFFPSEEFELLSALSEPDLASRFCELWTIKEACVKWCGLGVGRAIAGVGVAISAGSIALTLREDIVASDQLPDALLFAPAPNLRLAVVGDIAAGWSLQRQVPRQSFTAPSPASVPSLLPLARTLF